MQDIYLPNLKHIKHRCEVCADGEPPPAIWPMPRAIQSQLSFSRFTNPIDLEREPGIEG